MYMCVDTCSTYIAAASVPRQGRKIGKVQMAQPLREGKKVMLIWLLPMYAGQSSSTRGLGRDGGDMCDDALARQDLIAR